MLVFVLIVWRIRSDNFKFHVFFCSSLLLQIVVHKSSPRGTHFRRAGPRQRVYFNFYFGVVYAQELNSLMVAVKYCSGVFRVR